LRLVQSGRIRDALAALFRGKGIDEEMRWADQALVHRGGSLDSQQLIYQRGVHTAAKLCQGFGQDKVLLRAIELHFVEATRIHDGHVGAQPLADGFIRSAHFMFEQFQCQQDACRDRVATTMGAFGEALAKLCSTASTNLVQGNVSVHWRMELVLGTTSATWSLGPLPLSQC
jgi:hypothetical protein